MIHHIGHDFSKTINLLLFPNVDMDKFHWYVEITWVSVDVNSNPEFNSTTFTTHNKGNIEYVKFGRDVESIFVSATNLRNLVSSRTYSYNMRLDDLMLLNLASRLLKR